MLAGSFIVQATACTAGEERDAPDRDFGDSSRFGESIELLDDLDGDGKREFAVGHPTRRAGSVARVWVIAGTLDKVLREIRSPDQAREFGTRLSLVGDLNGDGVRELAVWALGHLEFARLPGRIRVFDPRTGASLASLEGATSGDLFGAAVDSAGDLDGDGVEDLLVGAPIYQGDRPGYVQVVSGRTGDVLRTVPGTHAGDRFGIEVAGGSDLDGDGVPDLVVAGTGPQRGEARLGSELGAFLAPAPGVVAFSGRTGAQLWRSAPRVEGDGAPLEEEVGLTLQLVPDADGDGTDDLWASISNDVLGGGPRAELLTGRDGSRIAASRPTSRENGDFFAASCVALVHDFDGDQILDLFVGADRSGMTGSVAIVSGYDCGTLGRLDAFDLTDEFYPRYLGTDVVGLGDLDTDGVPDLLCGVANFEGPAEAAGEVWVLSGRDLSVLRRLTASEVGSWPRPRSAGVEAADDAGG